jgi:hypothetical protein
MPLLKLWNSLCRRSKAQSNVDQSAAPVPQLASTPQPAAVSPSTVGEVTAKSAKVAKPAKRSLFGGPHSALCRQLKGLSVASVLEISVGDGSRALEVMKTLEKQSSQPVRYVAVDQFELGGSELALKDFFRLLREHEIRPQLFPEAVDSGLRRVANTIGAVDLVLIALPVDRWQHPITLHLLSRICHAGTIVFFRDGEAWGRYQPATTAQRRAA